MGERHIYEPGAVISDDLAREAASIVEEAKRAGFSTDETDLIAALAEVQRWKAAKDADAEWQAKIEAEREDALEDALHGGELKGPPYGSGSHSKGGLYGDQNDYFGKDREPLDHGEPTS